MKTGTLDWEHYKHIADTLVTRFVSRYNLQREEDDIRQVAHIELWRACQRIKPEKGPKPQVYLYQVIKGTLLKYLRDKLPKCQPGTLVSLDSDTLSGELLQNTHNSLEDIHEILEAIPSEDAKEIQLAGLLEEGYSSQEIAFLMNMKLQELEAYISELRGKYGLQPSGSEN